MTLNIADGQKRCLQNYNYQISASKFANSTVCPLNCNQIHYYMKISHSFNAMYLENKIRTLAKKNIYFSILTIA
jgi:hypothetical protein